MWGPHRFPVGNKIHLISSSTIETVIKKLYAQCTISLKKLNKQYEHLYDQLLNVCNCLFLCAVKSCTCGNKNDVHSSNLVLLSVPGMWLGGTRWDWHGIFKHHNSSVSVSYSHALSKTNSGCADKRWRNVLYNRSRALTDRWCGAVMDWNHSEIKWCLFG